MTRTNTLFRSGLLIVALAAFAVPRAAAQSGGECAAFAGSTLMEYGPDCLQNGHATISGIPNGDAVVPEEFTTAFLLSRTNGLIVEQVGPTPQFEVTTADVWRIHTLVFDPATFDPSDIEFGVTTAYDVAAQFTQAGGPICAAISFTVYGSKTMDCDEACEAFAAPATIDSTTVCLVDGQATLTAQLDGTHVIPEGFEEHYVLSRTNGLIIEQFADVPSFTVNSVDVWRIHSFVYDPATFDMGTVALGVTSIYDIYPQLVQGGGTICANLQISGAFVKTGECPKNCDADAGSLSAEQEELCLIDGMATATALPDGNAQVPEGSGLIYFLTQDGVILAIEEDPSFVITTFGQFRIHGFVYDMASFDPGSIVIGETTVDALAMALEQDEDLCASLDLDGAYFQVVDCTPTCDADAGAMVGGDQTICLEDGMAVLEAVSFGDTLVPPGFQLVYLLSEGNDLLLQAWSIYPFFAVNHPGEFHIHAFVLDTTTLDLNEIFWTEITILELNAQLLQGGGELCAGLDILGASFTVEYCLPACDGAGNDSTITVCYTDPPFQLFDFLGGAPCPGGTWTTPASPVVTGTFNPASDAAGMYTYTVIGVDGTVSTATVTVNVFECPDEALTPDAGDVADELPEAVALPALWPNPADGVLYVSLPAGTYDLSHVMLFDASGRAFSLPVMQRTSDALVLDVSKLATGTWTIRLPGSTTHQVRFVR